MTDTSLDMAMAVVRAEQRRMAIERARSYRAVFMPEAMTRDHEIVLADLRDHCFAQKSTFHPDPAIAARRQGQREAWLRIAEHLTLDEAQIQKLVELDDGL